MAAEIALMAALTAAFQATTYRVNTDAGVFDLRIGERHAAFTAFLRSRSISRWAIVTACNPGARACAAAHNAILQGRLLARLQAAGWALGRNLFPAVNRADRDDWPDEPGWLLLEIDASQARALVREFGQLACVYGEVGAVNSTGETSRTAEAAGVGRTDRAADIVGNISAVPRLLWTAGMDADGDACPMMENADRP